MKDIVSGIVLIVFSAIVYILSGKFPSSDRMYKDPALFPRVIVIIISLLALGEIVKGIRSLKVDTARENNGDRSATKPLILIILLLIYLILLHITGFVATTPVFITACIVFFGGNYKRGIVFSVIMTTGLYLLFANFFGITLPESIIW